MDLQPSSTRPPAFGDGASLLAEERVKLNAAINNISQGLLMLDREATVILSNIRYMEMYGLTPDDVRPGRTLLHIMEKRADAGLLKLDAKAEIAHILANVCQGRNMERLLYLTDGRIIRVCNHSVANGWWVATHEDITQAYLIQRDLEKTRRFLDTVLENVPATIIVKDAATLRYVLVNAAGEKQNGIARSEMIGKTARELFCPETADNLIRDDRMLLDSKDDMPLREHVVDTPGNGRRHVSTKRYVVRGQEGNPEYIVCLVQDVTERKKAEAEVTYLAHHDSLTGLPNRASFNKKFDECVARAGTSDGVFTLLWIDLDRFKQINDVFGHATGDDVLVQVCCRIKQACDSRFVARLGGDEFAILDQSDATAAGQLAEHLVSVMEEPFECCGHQLRIGLSIGAAVFPKDGADPMTLAGNADAALYRAKNDQRGAIRFFDNKMDAQLRERRLLQQDLRTAIERLDLSLAYQPIADFEGSIVGFEALIRWVHATRGSVPPNMIIPAAEDSGLMIRLGEWVLREACREAASWKVPLQVSVNLSASQFHATDLPTLVGDVLDGSGLQPGRLEREITEGMLLRDFSAASSTLLRLKAMGVKVVLDDFGTGYSSLSYVHSLPLDKIKIDRSFVSGMASGPHSRAIINAIVSLGRALNITVTAEGAETNDQLHFLREAGCDQVQGFLIGRPLAIEHYLQVVGGRRVTLEESSCSFANSTAETVQQPTAIITAA